MHVVEIAVIFIVAFCAGAFVQNKECPLVAERSSEIQALKQDAVSEETCVGQLKLLRAETEKRYHSSVESWDRSDTKMAMREQLLDDRWKQWDSEYKQRLNDSGYTNFKIHLLCYEFVIKNIDSTCARITDPCPPHSTIPCATSERCNKAITKCMESFYTFIMT